MMYLHHGLRSIRADDKAAGDEPNYRTREPAALAARGANSPVLSMSEQAALNLEEVRTLPASGASYRQIRRQLGLSSGQISHIRRALSRKKAAGTRLRRSMPGATDRDLPVSQSVLPAGLRRQLSSSSYRTLGDLADRLSDPDLPKLEAMPGIGPHKVALVTRLLDHYGLLPGTDNLRGAVEALFPDLAEDQ